MKINITQWRESDDNNERAIRKTTAFLLYQNLLQDWLQ
jgi:hypothetical protein